MRHPASSKAVCGSEGGTPIEVGQLATAGGSIITCHTCDGPYRTWVNIVPHRKWPDKCVAELFSGRLHTETPADLQGIIQAEEIPQVPETCQFLNTAYPCLNERGRAIGGIMIGGRQELVNSEGAFTNGSSWSVARRPARPLSRGPSPCSRRSPSPGAPTR